jgi:protein-S-isoprenylcysteine O-methyltransferase Ste14
VPPPVVAFVAAVLMWFVAAGTPRFSFDLPGHTIIAVAFACAGALVTLSGLIEFRRAHTTVNPLKPDSASALVTGGVYRITRNPMYVGLAVVLLGWGAFLSNIVALIGIAGFGWYIDRFQIAPEERALATLFGAEFDAYRRDVRRWL